LGRRLNGSRDPEPTQSYRIIYEDVLKYFLNGSFKEAVLSHLIGSTLPIEEDTES